MELQCTQVTCKYNFVLQAGQELLTSKNSAMKLYRTLDSNLVLYNYGVLKAYSYVLKLVSITVIHKF